MMSQKNNMARCLCVALGWVLTWHMPLSHAERADRNQPLHLEAEQVSIDDAKQISTFVGKVLLTQGTLTIRGDKLVVQQNQEGMQLGTTTGQPASFRQKREGVAEYVEGYAERIEYDSANTTVDLYGQARIQRGHDEVRGEHISYNFKTEIFQARSALDQGTESGSKGRVQVIIQPKKNPVPVDGNPTEQHSPTLIQPESTP